MGGQLWRFWHLREGTEILTELLARPAGDASAARAKALVGLAGLVYWQTDLEAAQRSYEEALILAPDVADEVLEVEILYGLACARAIKASYEGANRDLASAATFVRRAGQSRSWPRGLRRLSART